MAFALTIVFWAAITFFIFWFWRHLQLRKSLAKLPSPRSFPIVGHALIVKPDIEAFVDQLMAMALLYPKSPRVCLFWNVFSPLLMVYEARIAEKIFTNSAHLNKGQLYDMLKPWLGEGLLTSSAEPWKPRRKLLTPTFHYDILKNFVHIFNKQTDILIEQLERMCAENQNYIEDVGKPISLCALDIICESSMGQTVRAQSESESEYVRAVLRINDIIQNRQRNPLVRPDILFNLFGEGKEHQWAINVLHSFSRRVIKERRQALEEDTCTPNERPAFLDLLLELERQGLLDEKSIQEEVDTFMFEGHDTTSTAATWAMHVLGCYPNVQQKVLDEIQRVCGDAAEITLDHLSQLKYLECCLKEVLRLYPSVPMIVRRLGSKMQIGETEVPIGTEILINIYLIHRDPAYWKDPEVFDPDRFLPENANGRHAFAYIPFSAGSRNCIGQRFALMEEKIMVVGLVRAFLIESVRRRDEQACRTELILRPKGGVAVRLTPRGHRHI
ncbi:hypothetical protein M3Y98_00052400 [Aphelenchoides besseyi]|nr:hypothetical protein M3Y98_00052400 [Aphelenchoides besseyi]KAI6198925.1 hypothetical protein M3Y96_00572200 [Aphelenchoides besseyi]